MTALKNSKDTFNNKSTISLHMRTSEDFLKVGATVTFIGFMVVALGIVLTILQHPGSSQMGGLIMLGPIPIAFGSSPEITTNMLGLGLLIMILYLFLWKTKR
ncbi:DUF131 domain-containing protein [Methanosarcina sp. KYL-1]|uniref:TIGR00304 family membrane protein n=1 Tax=Methanosarcina sp. KYL-1 TaxID=2602068 RepID=UPI002101645C|nr:DUF131 domain-containing protein [Methanosarcina sp. KYL-1]